MIRRASVLLLLAMVVLGACRRRKAPQEETPTPTPVAFTCSRTAIGALDPKAGPVLSRSEIPAPEPPAPRLDRRVVICQTAEPITDCAERARAEITAQSPDATSVEIVGDLTATEGTQRESVTLLVTTAPEPEPPPVGERWSWFPGKTTDDEATVATLASELDPLRVDVVLVGKGGPGSLIVDVSCRDAVEEDTTPEEAPVETPPAESDSTPKDPEYVVPP